MLHISELKSLNQAGVISDNAFSYHMQKLLSKSQPDYYDFCAAIEDILTEEGRHDPSFKPGETIKYSPSTIVNILENNKEKLKQFLREDI